MGEGTGSMVFDHKHQKCYAALSDRTHPELLTQFCEEFGFEPVPFTACTTANGRRVSIYHTNVMMCIGGKFAVIGSSTIDNPEERERILKSLADTGREIVHLTEAQLEQFAGNMLEVGSNKEDEAGVLVMSQRAYNSLTPDQVSTLEKYAKIVTGDVKYIEDCGGGSARCMIAELFLPYSDPALQQPEK